MTAVGLMGVEALFELAVPPRHSHRSQLESAYRALAAMNLRVPADTPLVGVRTEPMHPLHRRGMFDRARPELGARVADDRPHSGYTMLHEIGHALDSLLLGYGGEYGSERREGAAWQTWYQACQSSTALRRIRAKMQTDDDDRIFAGYLYQPCEVFARSFAQWVISRAGDDESRRYVQELADVALPQQWGEDDFATLGPTIEALFDFSGGGR